MYDCFTARADASLDLIGGLYTPTMDGGVAQLSLAPGTRREHGDAYAAMTAGRIDTNMLRDFLAQARSGPVAAGLRGGHPGVDAQRRRALTAARLLPSPFAALGRAADRGVPVLLVADRIVSPGADSWTTPLDSQRVLVGENPNVVAAQHVRHLLPRLGGQPMPALFGFDGGYDPVQLTVETTDTGV